METKKCSNPNCLNPIKHVSLFAKNRASKKGDNLTHEEMLFVMEKLTAFRAGIVS